MPPAPPIMNPAMLGHLDQPPFDMKPWLPPIMVPQSKRSLPPLPWLHHLPHTPTVSSLISPLEPGSSALAPPTTNSSSSTPPVPTIPLVHGGPSYTTQQTRPLPYPIQHTAEQPKMSYASTSQIMPPCSQRFHPYPVPGGKHACSSSRSYALRPPTLPLHGHEAAAPLYAYLPGPNGQPMPVPLGAYHLPSAPIRPGRCAPPPPPPLIPLSGLPTPPASATLPPAAVLPRHPELVAHAAFAAALEVKRKRIIQWAADVCRSDAGDPEDPSLLDGQRGRGHSRARTGEYEYNAEDEAAEEAAARARRID